MGHLLSICQWLDGVGTRYGSRGGNPCRRTPMETGARHGRGVRLTGMLVASGQTGKSLPISGGGQSSEQNSGWPLPSLPVHPYFQTASPLPIRTPDRRPRSITKPFSRRQRYDPKRRSGALLQKQEDIQGMQHSYCGN